MDNPVCIVFITTGEYAMSTGVAVHSLRAHREPSSRYEINILCCGVSKRNAARLKAEAEDNFSIFLTDVAQSNPEFLNNTLLKLPQILTNKNRVLYLDSDTLIQKDLTELFNTDLGQCCVAAVADPKGGWWNGEDFNTRMGLKNPVYFSTGVMLLDLQRIRETGKAGQIQDAASASCQLSQQEVLNMALGDSLLPLPIAFNLMPKYAEGRTAEWLCENFPLQSREACSEPEKAAAVLHFSGAVKPWKYSEIRWEALWMSSLKASSFCDEKLEREVWQKERLKRLPHLQEITLKEPKVSVIIPVYNAQQFISDCLESILGQTDFEDIEVILIDDGSKDDSLWIVQQYAKLDPRLKILTQENLYAGVARNRGITEARGEYLAFVDADDKLFSGKNLSSAYVKAHAESLDELVCTAIEMRNDGSILGNLPYALRMEMLPAKPVFNVMDLGAFAYVFSVGAPWAKLFRRAFVIGEKIQFSPYKRSEDIFFTQMCITRAKRIAALNIPVVLYRLRDGNSLETTKDETPLIFWEADRAFAQAIAGMGLSKELDIPVRLAAMERLHYNLRAMTTYKAFKEVFTTAKEEIYPEVVLPEDSVDHRFFNSIDQELKNYMESSSAEEFLHCAFLQQKRLLREKDRIIQDLQNSLSFRVGGALAWLPRKIRKILKRIIKKKRL